jgi:hypothetical protein
MNRREKHIPCIEKDSREKGMNHPDWYLSEFLIKNEKNEKNIFYCPYRNPF